MMLCKLLSASQLLLLLFFSYATHVLATQPTYQVSIYLSVHPRAPLVHICNGVILQRRIILTTASCVQNDNTMNVARGAATTSGNDPVAAARLRVVAGQANVVDETAAFVVDAVHVLGSFDPITLDDDLAVLRLKHALPLGLRDDMKWIVADDNERRDNGCMANFQARNLIDGIPENQQEEKMLLQPPKSCGMELPTHSQDFCAHYLLPQHFDCEQYDEYKRFNADRGTGLVCSSRLVALLSQTMSLPPSIEWHCSERPVPAMYVALAPHNDWIYQFIMTEEMNDISGNNYVASQPYDENDPKVTSRPSNAGFASTTDMDTTIPMSTATTSTTPSTTNTDGNNNNNNNGNGPKTMRPLLPTILPLGGAGSGSYGDDGNNSITSSAPLTSFRCAHTLLATTICCFLLLSLLQRQLSRRSL